MHKILLVGNPNAGKTTLFNALTRSDEHVGNWHGVTVDAKAKEVTFDDQQVQIVDTPGIYSLKAMSLEEEVSINEILQNKDKKIVNLCDQNTLARSLYLSLCLLEEGCDVLLIANQPSLKATCKVDFAKLSKLLNVEIVATNLSKCEGLDKIRKKIFLPKKVANLPYFACFGGKSEQEKAESRYQYIDFLLNSCSKQTGEIYGKSKVDKILLNKYLAIPCFLAIMAGVFFLTFFLIGDFLSQLLSNALKVVTTPILNVVESWFGSGWVFDLFAVAVVGGLSTVLTFLPQVVLLFLFLSILEDSGYMARVAFVFEDLLGRVGLSGKSIYTLLMGFGCSTSAIMTARTMDEKKAKIKTAMICPYMSCSAKIPIYTVIGAAVFGAKNLWCIVGLYLLGIVIALCVSKVCDKTILKSDNQTFILEFPPYRMISLKRIARVLIKNTKQFVSKVASVMIATNVIVWVLSSFDFAFVYVAGTNKGSMLESFGKILAPIFAPLGFGNWAIVAALLAGVVAKEVVVSSIAMFNGIDAGNTNLISQSIFLSTSVVCFASKASVVSFLVFCLLYVPCLSSMAMLWQEIGKKWTFFAIFVQFCVAYVTSFVIYNIAFAIEIFGFGPVLCLICGVGCVAFAVLCVVKKFKLKKGCSNCDNCRRCKR